MRNGLKNTKGKLPLPSGSLIEPLQAQGFVVLPIHARHIDALRRLSIGHSDPFDRLLLAQATDEGIRLLTRDIALLNCGLAAVANARWLSAAASAIARGESLGLTCARDQRTGASCTTTSRLQVAT